MHLHIVTETDIENAERAAEEAKRAAHEAYAAERAVAEAHPVVGPLRRAYERTPFGPNGLRPTYAAYADAAHVYLPDLIEAYSVALAREHFAAKRLESLRALRASQQAESTAAEVAS